MECPGLKKTTFSDKEKLSEILTVQVLQSKVMLTYLHKTTTCPGAGLPYETDGDARRLA